MNQEQVLRAALVAALGTQSVRCCVVSDMWVIEVVLPGLLQPLRAQLLQQIQQVMAQALQGQHVIWKVFLYATGQQRFNVDGTLHTLEAVNVGGIYTVTLSANDCYVWLTEYDGEVLQLGDRPGLAVMGIQSTGENGLPILPFQPHGQYTWLEALGGSYDLAENGVVPVPNSNPLELQIQLN